MGVKVPDYDKIGGEPQQNDKGEHYKIFVGGDSDGNPGKWHVYYNGDKVFLAGGGPSSMGGNEPNSMASSAAATIAAAPAPVQPNGGVQAPDTSQPAVPAGSVTLVPTSVGTATADPVPTISAAGDQSQGTNSGSTSDTQATTTVVATASSTGVNHADGLHNVSGFSGQASEVHGSTQSSAPEVANPVSTATVTPIAADGAGSPFDATPPTATVQSTALPDGGVSTNGPTYTVAEGDNMWDIAQAHNMSLEQLTALNPQITNPELILPGQEINIGVLNPVASDSGDASFPTTSTYDSTSSVAAEADTRDSHNINGWSDGTSGVPNDPTHGIASVAQVQTDPLKINDNKQTD